MKSYAYGINESEKKQLTDVLNTIQEVLAGLILHDQENQVFPPLMGKCLLKAWHDMPSHFEEIRVKLALKDELALSLHGLTGGQLELKLALISLRLGGYHEALTNNGFTPDTKEKLRQLLVAFDILVFDLIQATNSGGAVSSLHKCLISLLDY